MQKINFSTIPYLTPERSKKIFGIVLTLCALALFGFFAIKPTISTILRLQKELADNQFVFDQMEIKIKNLSTLRAQYSNLENKNDLENQSDLEIVTSAITSQPDAHVLFAQIQSIAQTSGVVIEKIQNPEIEILKNNKLENKNYSSYDFTVAGSGSFENILKFLQILTNMERIINIDTFSINGAADQENKSSRFTIQGTTFFKDNL